MSVSSQPMSGSARAQRSSSTSPSPVAIRKNRPLQNLPANQLFRRPMGDENKENFRPLIFSQRSSGNGKPGQYAQSCRRSIPREWFPYHFVISIWLAKASFIEGVTAMLPPHSICCSFPCLLFLSYFSSVATWHFAACGPSWKVPARECKVSIHTPQNPLSMQAIRVWPR